jgi:hypothetical protein
MPTSAEVDTGLVDDDDLAKLGNDK